MAKSYVDWINKQQEVAKQQTSTTRTRGQFTPKVHRLFTPKTAGKTGTGHGGYFTEGKQSILTSKPINPKRGVKVSRMTVGGYEWLSKRRSASQKASKGMTPMMPPNEMNLREGDIKKFDIDNQLKRKIRVAKYNVDRRFRSEGDPQKPSDMFKPLGKKTMRGGGKSGGGGKGLIGNQTAKDPTGLSMLFKKLK